MTSSEDTPTQKSATIKEVCEYLLRAKVWGEYNHKDHQKNMEEWVKKLGYLSKSNKGANFYDDLKRMRGYESHPEDIKKWVERMYNMLKVEQN